MTGKTHRAGGVVAAMVGFTMLKNHGLLFDNINPLVQFAVIYPFAYWGSTASDLDHNPESIPSKDIVSKAINKVLHLTEKIDNGKNPVTGILNAKHRSWQTHSVEIFALLILLLNSMLKGKFASLGDADTVIISLMLMGVIIGILAHLVLDVITPSGILIATTSLLNSIFKLKLPTKIHLVPNLKFFATGGTWENLIYRILSIASVLCFIYLVLQYTAILPFDISFY